MTDIKINNETCSKCGACVKECCNNVLSISKGDFPVVEKPHMCIECGRCMARCSSGAIQVGTLPEEKFVKSASPELISSKNMELFLKSKRSCRSYSDITVEKEDLETLLEVAQIAPTAMNSQEKGFVVIRNEEKIDDIRKAVLKESVKIYRLMRILSSAPFKYLFPRDTAAFFLRAKNDYKSLLESADKGIDHLFYNAPVLVFFTGIAMDSMGKDNALYAMNYFMFQAETMGLGTCINGFSSLWPKILAKFTDLPDLHKVYGVVTLGYKKEHFLKTISRNKPEVNWIL